MCGIAGLYGTYKTVDKERAIASLSQSLQHRGPDGQGVYEADGIALVHTRLSIIDLTEQGNQPLYNEDKSLVLICNGEIYNYQQLRAELITKGHTFASHSDCEVILHLYEEYKGDTMQLLSRLTGMFAFALWDTKRRQLIVARDRIGIKPLYYSYDKGRLLFASEVAPIADSRLVAKDIDHTSVYEYFLTGSIPGPNTVYAAVKCLPAGHYMAIANNELTIKEYWDIPKGTKKWSGEDEVSAAVETMLSQVIKEHLVADVPVGTFLSAGVDSSLITAIAVQYHPGIHSFTASFPGEPEDEGMVAVATAKKLKTTHHAYELKNNFFTDFAEQFQDMDQPFAIPSALSLGRISKIAKEHVKVVLSGDGADELFGGYNRHEFPKRPDFLKAIPKAMRNAVLQTGAKITGKKSLEALRQNLAITEGEAVLSRIMLTTPDVILPLFAPEVTKQIDTERYLRHLNGLFAKRKGEDELARILYVDMKTTLVDEMLTKCDRMTMINGIEGRVPFLDHRLVELAFSIPSVYKRKDGVGKVVLRRILAKKLGNELAYRVKTGFNSPLQQWLSADPATKSVVKAAFHNAAELKFINKQVMHAQESKPYEQETSLALSVVCLNYFLQHEDTGTH